MNHRARLFQSVANAQRADRSRSPPGHPSLPSDQMSGFSSMDEAFTIIPEQIVQSMVDDVGQGLQRLQLKHWERNMPQQ